MTKLVDWAQLQDVAAALAVPGLADCDDSAIWTMAVLMNRLTLPLQLLEELDGGVEGVIAGDPVAASLFADRLEAMVRELPELRGSREQLAVFEDRGRQEPPPAEVDDTTSTVSFDGLVRLGAAIALVTRERSLAAREESLDVLLGLAVHAGPADLLTRALRSSGAEGVQSSLATLFRRGSPLSSPIPPMQVRGESLPAGEIPGLPRLGGPGGHVGTGGLLGIPGLQLPGPDTDGVPAFIDRLITGLRDRKHWHPEIVDSRPTWRDIVGVPIPEVIDHEQIRRIACWLDLDRALALPHEPPPVAPDRLVWADGITSITAPGHCAGDRIMLLGSGFGPPLADRGVVLPTSDGCKAFAVPAADWTDTAVTVTLPATIASGPIGFVDLAYVRAYDDWATRQNELTRRILEDAKCAHVPAPDVQYVLPFHQCAPDSSTNSLRAGVPVIRSFAINGAPLVCVEPGSPLRLDWDLRNVETCTLERLGSTGPAFAGAGSMANPPGTTYPLGPFNAPGPTEAAYRLHATGPCGDVEATVRATVRKVPILEIDGLEVTQGIQAFRDPSAGTNTLPLVAGKDTVVRVYVAVENMNGFGWGVSVSGELLMPGSPQFKLPPIGLSAEAHPRATMDRARTDSSLNFRIPAGLCSGTTTLTAHVWATDAVEAPPTGQKVRPEVSRHKFPLTWTTRAPYKVRYVRISSPGNPGKGDAEARDLVVKAFDYLPTPATDIAPARMPTWHTSLDISGPDGITDLLGHLDDQHDCTRSEALFFWEDDCPPDDHAVWVGILPNSAWGGGLAQSYRAFDVSRNTVVATSDPKTIAHELGHTLKCNHVNPDVRCPGMEFRDGEDYDTLPDGGAIAPGDGFDVRNGTVVPVLGLGILGTYDLMTYACYRWVSRSFWQRIFNKF